MTAPDDAEQLAVLIAEREIRAVLARYCRGIDRVDLELVRSCYHPDAADDHGRYQGDVDGFIEWVGPTLRRFERTMHVLGTCGIEVRGNVAAVETYAVAYHRGVNPAGILADHIVGLRYLDRFERRDRPERLDVSERRDRTERLDLPERRASATAAATWLIARRTCALEWRRDDPVIGSGAFPPDYTLGRRGPDDLVYSLFD